MTQGLLQITERIPTPFLLVDQDILERNIRGIQAYADHHGLIHRPHVKTHKSLEIAGMQTALGAGGLACAKVEEAKVMAGAGHRDITVAYPALGLYRARELACLAKTCRIRVALDSRYIMDELARAAVRQNSCIGIMPIFDPGLGRCGTADPEIIVELARYARDCPGLRFDGIQMYMGHLYGDRARDEKEFAEINRKWEPVYQALADAGLKPHIVSSGSSPSLRFTHLISHVNELRVGTAVLNDYFELRFGHCTPEECAARVVATVVSDAVPGQVIMDAGSKTLSAKQLLRREKLEMGHIPEYPEARIFRLHEEHGWIDVSRCEKKPALGERISIVPVNISLCVNLFDFLHLASANGEIKRTKVDARGCLV